MTTTRDITARHALRTATAQDHERVDRAFAGYDLSDRVSYAAFLMAQASAFLPVEAAIEAATPESVLPDWPHRRRAALLRADLDTLGAAVPAPAGMPAISGAEELLGAVYVLEGSRLGGRLLARSVPSDLPSRFIGASDPTLWRGLIEKLDFVLVSEQQRNAAIGAARRVFAMFEDGARHYSKDAMIG